MMTEAQAWSYLARRWDKATFHTPGSTCVEVTIMSQQQYGLCGSVSTLNLTQKVTNETWLTMFQRMQKYKPRDAFMGYWWPCNKAGAKSRAAFCRKMVKLSRKRRG